MKTPPRSLPAATGFAAAVLVGATALLAADLKDIHPDFELPFRQVHLDFHTSEHVPGVASEFDADAFAATLDNARVNSVTVFGRCHHGWIYYDTRRFPERRFPGLRCNLLKEQIEACHRRGIRAPIYVTVQWDHRTASEHPEWLMRTEKGDVVGDSTDPLMIGFYRRICLNSPYAETVLYPMLDDLFDCVPVDGLFLDIVAPQPCWCEACRKGMADSKLDAKAFAGRIYERFCVETTRRIRARGPATTIFYNGGHIGPSIRGAMDAFTHFEMESLPSGGWGYLHFPLTARYARTLGKDGLGMTGKFHTSWGDFHSYKNPAALQFECYLMLALGAKCSVGDQLHPAGRLDEATYRLIGSVYEDVERKEPWCRRARALTDLAVMSPEPLTGERVPEAAAGAVRMLQESFHQFDVVDFDTDLAPYKVVLLPDVITLDDALERKLSSYLAGGGAILASFESGLDRGKAAFRLAALGVTKTGEGPLDPQGKPVRGRTFSRNNFVDYVRPGPEFGGRLPPADHVMYALGVPVAATDGAVVLAQSVGPYFHRIGDRFISHRQTPSSGEATGPAIVRNGRCVYLSHPVFSQYHRTAPRWYRELAMGALAQLLPDPILRAPGAPTTAIFTLNEQPGERRWVLHALHYIPERRGQAFDVIEDVIPLRDTAVSVRSAAAPSRVRLVPEGTAVPFRHRDGRIEFTLPEIRGHRMVEIAF